MKQLDRWNGETLSEFYLSRVLDFEKCYPGYPQINPNVVEQRMMSNGDMSTLNWQKAYACLGNLQYNHNYRKFHKKVIYAVLTDFPKDKSSMESLPSKTNW